VRRAFLLIALLAAPHITLAAELTSREMIGAWTFGIGSKNHSYYTFWSNHRYSGVHGDEILRGTWKLFEHGKKLEMILGGGIPKDQLSVPSTREVVVIDSFDGQNLHVTLADGQKDIWKKMPRWKGSPKY